MHPWVALGNGTTNAVKPSMLSPDNPVLLAVWLINGDQRQRMQPELKGKLPKNPMVVDGSPEEHVTGGCMENRD